MSNRGRHKKSNKHLIIQILGSKIADRIMECQKEQGNIPNLDIFLNSPSRSKYMGGFNWSETKEGHAFWDLKMIGIFQQHPLYKEYMYDRS